MKISTKFAHIILALPLIFAGCAKKSSPSWKSISDPAMATQLKSFVAEKEAQANSSTNASASEYTAFFAAARNDDWPGVNQDFKEMQNHAAQFQHSGSTDDRLRGTRWQDVLETWGALEAFHDGDEKYSAIFANDIIQSIPPGSIYFGGTDPGRFLVGAMQKSQVNGDPFFTLTQNALADGSYLDYLRNMYGNQIYIPSAEDSQKCFEDYDTDVKARLENHELKPGEHATVDSQTGKVQISGYTSVMAINALLVKTIFDHNTKQDYYIEQSYPLDWMNPYLEPHGLIFKLNQHPLDKISDETVQQDHDYWAKAISPMIGDWLNDDTAITQIADFAQKAFLQHDFSNSKADPEFVRNAYSHRMFSKERCSIAALYAWRAQNSTDEIEKARMNQAADFAYRQAWALCPYSPEAVFGYVQFLMGNGRSPDALLVAETAAKFRNEKGISNGQIDELVEQLKRQQK